MTDDPATRIRQGRYRSDIKTLVNEWAYTKPFQTSENSNRWLASYLGIYNGHRCHMALGGISPKQCPSGSRSLSDLMKKHA